MKYKLYKPFALLLSYIMLIMMMANLTFAEENNDSVNTFNVPVVMKNINGSGAVSMGNGAIAGDAVVTEKDGKAEIEIPIKAVDIYGLHGHLLKLWSYDDGLESEKTEAEIVETVTEEGLDGEGEYPSKIKITRNAIREEKIYIRISVDAMDGFDQDAILELDYTNIPLRTDEPEELPSEAPDAEPTEDTTPSIEPSVEPTESTAPDEEIVFSIPVAMKNINGSGAVSMGNGAIAGDAVVTEKDGKAEIEIPIKAVDIYGLHGHLLKLWSYDDGLESEKTEAEIVETVTEEGLDGEGEYPSKIKITRNTIREEKIYIRISVDAMAGFDQDAILELDYTSVTIPTIEPTQSPEASQTPSPTPAGTDDPGSGAGGGAVIEQRKNYLVDIAFWHEVSDQVSMGDCALESNPQALYKSTGSLMIATNAVEVSGYRSGITGMMYDYDEKGNYKAVNIMDRNSISTGTSYDGTDHTVTYITLSSFALPDYLTMEGVEYINIKIKVPYTPMSSSASLDENGYMTARLRIDWRSLEETTLTTLKPSKGIGSGSISSGSSKTSFTIEDGTTGIILDGDTNILTKSAKLVIDKFSDDTINKKINEKYDNKIFCAYNISALVNGKSVEVEDRLQFRIPAVSEDLRFCIIDKYGKITELNAVLEDEYYKINITLPANLVIIGCEGIQKLLPATQAPDPTQEPVAENDTEYSFDDIKNHYAKEYIQKAADNGWVNGIEKEMFRPDMYMTRAMAAEILYRMNDSPRIDPENIFIDVENTAWYFNSVIWCSDNGIIDGIEADRFCPNDMITREQLITMLYRMYCNSPLYIDAADVDLTQYEDISEISEWAKDAVVWSVGIGLIDGDDNNRIDPLQNITRAEMAITAVRYNELINGRRVSNV